MNHLWDRCLDVLRTKVSPHALTTWLSPVNCEGASDGRVELSVPNNFFISWIKDNYLTLIQDSLLEVTGTPYEIDFRSRGETAQSETPSEAAVSSNMEPDANAGPISEKYALRHNLNPGYTFESFVVGSCNQFASAAALAVADNLAGTYNPLFIYGGVGLGKTHLMSAVGYSVLSKDRNRKVSFCTSEEFTNEMINAIRFDRMVEFRNKYRNVDLLLIDDIQFIAGKERTQEEFFHTFNTIYENRKQVVITSDRLPNEISDIEQRLKSRFNWGLVADLGVPDLETRIAILKRKAFEDKLELPDGVAHFLAKHVDSNIRELVGCLIRVVAMSSLQGLPLTTELAEKSLAEMLPRHTKTITIDEIIGKVSKAFNVKPADVKSRKKHKLYSLPRQIGMYLSRELTECSYPEIGTAFGGKDHSTVIYATRKIEKKLSEDQAFASQVQGLMKDIRG